MKYHNKKLSFSSILLILALFASCKTSEEVVTKTNLALEADSYVFEAQSASPTGRGRNVNLSHGYSVKISKDTINAYLPYFGVAYVAPLPGQDGGIKFVSTDFDYHKSDKKKGSWTVDIKIKDSKEQHRLTFQIGENGYATLYVREKDRQAISFYGRIE